MGVDGIQRGGSAVVGLIHLVWAKLINFLTSMPPEAFLASKPLTSWNSG